MKQIKKKLLMLGLCLGVAFATPCPSFAKTEESAPKEAVIPVQYKEIESAGLYHNIRQGSLGRDVWHGATRSVLSHLLRDAPAQSTSRTLNILNKKLLLSAANSTLLKDDIEIEAGSDLLTLRLNRLLDMGVYKETFEQYSLLNNEPYHDNLARAGVLSMLYNKERSLACLEANTIKDRFAGISFWDTFVAYCDNALSKKSDKKFLKILKNSDQKILHKASSKKKYKFPYSAEKFSTLSRLEQGVIIAGDSLSFKNTKPEDLAFIPTRHVLLLLEHANLPKGYKTLLSIRAVKLGLLEPSALTTLYKENTDAYKKPKGKKEDEDKKFSSIQDALKTWQKPSFFYITASNTNDNAERWKILRKALALEDTLGIAALSPFASMLSKTSPLSSTLKEINAALRIMHIGDVTFSKKWHNSLKEIETEQKTHSDKYKNLAFALFISKPKHKRTTAETSVIKGFFDKTVNKNTLMAINIIETLDRNRESVDNAVTVYDKAYYLTSAFNYVMPTTDVMDRLILSSKNGSVSETILLSASILRSTKAQDLYPGVLREITSSLSSVGLINVSKDLVIEAILED